MQRASRNGTCRATIKWSRIATHQSEPRARAGWPRKKQRTRKHPTPNTQPQQQPNHNTAKAPRPPCYRPPSSKRRGAGSQIGPEGRNIAVATKSRPNASTRGSESRIPGGQPANQAPTQQTKPKPRQTTTPKGPRYFCLLRGGRRPGRATQGPLAPSETRVQLSVSEGKMN